MHRRLGRFIWDLKKEAANLRKHGVDFETAAQAFRDPKRTLYTDEAHSRHEPRMFCLGAVGGRVVTVRFTYRGGLIRIYGAGYWRNKGGATMRGAKADKDLPIGRLTPIKDVLPPPQKLAVPEQTVKVTLLLSKASVRFFKEYAAQHGTKYQRMIRELVDRYTGQYSR